MVAHFFQKRCVNGTACAAKAGHPVVPKTCSAELPFFEAAERTQGMRAILATHSTDDAAQIPADRSDLKKTAP